MAPRGTDPTRGPASLVVKKLAIPGLVFPRVKLLDYNSRWSELERLKARETRRDEKGRLQWKLQLVRGLYERGLERKDILELLRFIDWIMRLPEELEARFLDQVERYEMEASMRYVTSFERIYMKRGLEQGIQQGETRLLRRQLLRRFQQLPRWVEERLEQASLQDLENWADRVIDATRLEDVFEPA